MRDEVDLKESTPPSSLAVRMILSLLHKLCVLLWSMQVIEAADIAHKPCCGL